MSSPLKRPAPYVGASPPAKKQQLDYLGTITVVACDGSKFTVHKDHVCQKSKFFKAATSRSWSEGRGGVVKLPTVEAAILKLYIHWAYTDNINVGLLGLEVFDANTYTLVKLYVAADIFLDIPLMNRIMDMLYFSERRKAFRAEFTCTAVNFVWENTMQGAPIRRLILAVFSTSEASEKLPQWTVIICKEFLIDLAVYCARSLRNAAQPAEESPGQTMNREYRERVQYHEALGL